MIAYSLGKKYFWTHGFFVQVISKMTNLAKKKHRQAVFLFALSPRTKNIFLS